MPRTLLSSVGTAALMELALRQWPNLCCAAMGRALFDAMGECERVVKWWETAPPEFCWFQDLDDEAKCDEDFLALQTTFELCDDLLGNLFRVKSPEAGRDLWQYFVAEPFDFRMCDFVRRRTPLLRRLHERDFYHLPRRSQHSAYDGGWRHSEVPWSR